MKVDVNCASRDGGDAPRDTETDRRVRRAYFLRMYGGGRSGFARALDYVMLRLIAFIAAYLFFAPRFANRGIALLLSAVALGIVMLVLRIAHEIAFERFVRKETARIRRALLADRLMLLDLQTAIGLCSGLCPLGETPVVLQRALPVDADALLAILRKYAGFTRLHVFSCTTFTQSAADFAARMGGRMTLHNPEALLEQAVRTGMTVEQQTIDAFIAAEQRRHRAGRRARRASVSPFAASGGKRYLITALVLVGISFLTRYTLYYRMLAGLCMSIAACGALLARPGMHASADAGHTMP